MFRRKNIHIPILILICLICAGDAALSLRKNFEKGDFVELQAQLISEVRLYSSGRSSIPSFSFKLRDYPLFEFYSSNGDAVDAAKLLLKNAALKHSFSPGAILKIVITKYDYDYLRSHAEVQKLNVFEHAFYGSIKLYGLATAEREILTFNLEKERAEFESRKSKQLILFLICAVMLALFTWVKARPLKKR